MEGLWEIKLWLNTWTGISERKLLAIAICKVLWSVCLGEVGICKRGSQVQRSKGIRSQSSCSKIQMTSEKLNDVWWNSMNCWHLLVCMRNSDKIRFNTCILMSSSFTSTNSSVPPGILHCTPYLVNLTS